MKVTVYLTARGETFRRSFELTGRLSEFSDYLDLYISGHKEERWVKVEKNSREYEIVYG